MSDANVELRLRSLEATVLKLNASLATVSSKSSGTTSNSWAGNLISALKSVFRKGFSWSAQVVDVDHGQVVGLDDDDHAQYLLLTGRAGGQTIIGGTGSGNDLTMSTTSHATKGSYIFSELTTPGVLANDSAGVVTGGNGLLALSDVVTNNLQNGDTLVYHSGSGMWRNSSYP